MLVMCLYWLREVAADALSRVATPSCNPKFVEYRYTGYRSHPHRVVIDIDDLRVLAYGTPTGAFYWADTGQLVSTRCGWWIRRQLKKRGLHSLG